MKLTRYTDYALRVLIYLSLNPDRQCSIAEIADSYGASVNHLMKVVQQLSRDGFIASVRGRGGGLMLGIDPQNILIGAVVLLNEPDMDLADCATCVISNVCGLTSMFGSATAAFLKVLDSYTLADVIRSGDTERALQRLGLRPKAAVRKRPGGSAPAAA